MNIKNVDVIAYTFTVVAVFCLAYAFITSKPAVKGFSEFIGMLASYI